MRAAIPATSHLNVIKYANLVSLLQTNELLGNYRNLFWFGTPIGLPLVEWTAAVFYGALFAAAFCTVFARAQLLPAAKRGLVLGLTRRTKATSVIKEEGRKLFVLNGAAVFLAAFLAFGVYQGVTSESYIDADEIYYAYYMKHISGPWTAESRDWLTAQGEEFAPMLAVQRRVARGELSNEAMLAYGALQQKYNIYQQVVQNNINYYLKEHPGAWLVYESGYKKLFGFSGTADVQDTLWAGLLCALCFSGLFAMERKGGMDEILASTPLGRKYTVKAKLRQSTAVAAVIAFGTVLPHLWQVLRDYGLPLFAGTGDEYLRLAGCTQVYNPVGFADFLVNLSFRGLPLHEPDHLMAWTEIGEFADCALYQCSCLLPARAAEPFRNEKWYRVAGILSSIPCCSALAKPRL